MGSQLLSQRYNIFKVNGVSRFTTKDGHNLRPSYQNGTYAESMAHTRNIAKAWQRAGKKPDAYSLILEVNNNSRFDIKQELAMKVIKELEQQQFGGGRRRLSVGDRLAKYEQHF